MRFLYFLSLFFLLTFTSQAQPLRVAVAANAQYVAEVLKEAFTKETGVAVELIVGSSGKLTAQLQQGAPFDVFLSADTKYPEALFQAGLTTASPKVYAYGVLVLWSMQNQQVSKGLPGLLDSRIKKVAVANHETAPYGEAALQALRYAKIDKPLQSKLVFGESVTQVNQYIMSEAADAGFTAKSVVLEPSMKGKGKWVAVDPKSYTPIAQAAVILKTAQKRKAKEAQQFYNFLFGKKAKVIFQQYGYVVK
jgi:molybdate transport system substrate-binding protein